MDARGTNSLRTCFLNILLYCTPKYHFYFYRANSGSGGENNSRTIGGGNRSFMPMRSASMRETSHSRSIRRYLLSSNDYF